MDERTKKSSNTTRQIPGGTNTQRTRTAPNGSNRKRRTSRRRRKRNFALKICILVFIIAAVIGGAFLLKRYGSSKEKADLKKYYGIEQENQMAVIAVSYTHLDVYKRQMQNCFMRREFHKRHRISKRVFLLWNRFNRKIKCYLIRMSLFVRF